MGVLRLVLCDILNYSPKTNHASLEDLLKSETDKIRPRVEAGGTYSCAFATHRDPHIGMYRMVLNACSPNRTSHKGVKLHWPLSHCTVILLL